jgi:hypothetical protein
MSVFANLMSEQLISERLVNGSESPFQAIEGYELLIANKAHPSHCCSLISLGRWATNLKVRERQLPS